jgi:protein-S-isoprenylcysteine O-methyltransferase Ste14
VAELAWFAAIVVAWAVAEAATTAIDRPAPRTLATATGVCLLASHVAGIVEHLVRHSHGSLAGVALALAGVALRIWAIATLGPRFASRLDTDRVIATGPYRWLRHPSEVGLVLAMAGCAVVLGSYAALAATVVALPFAAVRCARENAALRSA